MIEEIIKPVLPKEMIGKKINYLINPTGRFVIGGPQGDCGLTGRKIIVDTYGGAARTAAARSPARTRRRSTARPPTRRATSPRTSSPPGLATKAQVQVSYAIGVAKPTSIMVDHRSAPAKSPTRSSRSWSRSTSTCARRASSRCSTCCARSTQKTAAYGHFGRTEPEFTWEKTDKAEALAADAGVKRAANG